MVAVLFFEIVVVLSRWTRREPGAVAPKGLVKRGKDSE
jgi:hypothetical protein